MQSYGFLILKEAYYFYGNDLISQQQGEEELFYLEDGHSEVRQLVDENGMVTDSYSYDAYGNLLGNTGTNENDYLYRGEQFDESLDLQYLRARYYDPTTGRFISTDPFEGVLEQPVSRHRYLYGNSNPVTFLDPSGKVSIAEVTAINKIVGTLAALSITQISATKYLHLKSTQRPIKWDGLIGLGTAGFAATAPFNAGGGFALADSECVHHNGKEQKLVNLPILIGMIGASPSPLPTKVGGSGGTFEVYTPSIFGPRFYALLGSFSLVGGAIVPAFVGIGAAGLQLGFGLGWALGVSAGVFDVGVAAFVGASIPIPLPGFTHFENCNVLPPSDDPPTLP
jgi:RHS repeat-associated protein